MFWGKAAVIILTEDFSEYQSLYQPLFFERKLNIQIYHTLVNALFFHALSYVLLTRKLYLARFITQFVLCHSTWRMMYPIYYVTPLELKCNSLCTLLKQQLGITWKTFWLFETITIVQDELQSLENCLDTLGSLAASYRWKMCLN